MCWNNAFVLGHLLVSNGIEDDVGAIFSYRFCCGFVSAPFWIFEYSGSQSGTDYDNEREAVLISFISWKSYLIIIIMVTLGVLLRHSEIPKHYLAILYTGIGLALILSSVRYMRVFFRELRKLKSS